MKSIFTQVLVAAFLTGCGVTVKDKQGEPENVQEAQLQALIVEKEYSLPVPQVPSQQQTLRIDRLVLKPGSRFITQGLNLRLEVQELISEDGFIQSFKEDQIAGDLTVGRSGGQLELVIGKATGKFTVIMRGERGGKGPQGPAPDASLKGPTGAEGKSMVWMAIFPGRPPVNIGEMTAGSQGGQGAPGFTGAPGMRGGDSGRAFVKVFESSDTEFQILNFAGMGGVGGDGGAGGDGGNGGAGGKSIGGGANIPQMAGGPIGPQGPQGNPGPVGPSGIIESSCSETDVKSLFCQ